MSFPKYPEYKDSGVQWLGEVPAHWNVKPLKYLTSFINGMAFKPNQWANEGIPIIRIENLNDSDTFNFYNGQVDRRYYVTEDDLLFGWSGNKGTSFGPYIWKKKGRFYLNQHIFRLSNLSADKKWLYWSLKAVTKTIEDQAHGIIGMVHITKGKLGVIPVPFLPENEQQAIAAFLDRQTARIDALIKEQQRLIELLKEKRQAVISHAVTKGLDLDVPMKDSGVEWLGQVPAHWDVCSVKYATDLITDGAHISPETTGGKFHFISTKDLDEDSIIFEGSLLTSPESYDYLVRNGCRPEEGDILFSKDGTVGKTVIVREKRDFVVASSLIIIRPDQTFSAPEFLNYVCRSKSFTSQVDSFVKGAGLPRLSIQNLLKVVGAFPPTKEQRKIEIFLNSEIEKFTQLISEAQTGSELLRERRAALISAAVTGKIDVRNWQAPVAAQTESFSMAPPEAACEASSS